MPIKKSVLNEDEIINPGDEQKDEELDLDEKLNEDDEDLIYGDEDEEDIETIDKEEEEEENLDEEF